MASWTEGVLLLSVGLALGCGSKPDETGAGADPDSPAETCESQPWSWQNTGEPFMRTWCTQCHHSDLAEGDRQGAPVGVDLETHADALLWRDRIEARVWADSAPMPPAGGPSTEELEVLAEWLACGAPE
jgi:uncharacterized membrane protein